MKYIVSKKHRALTFIGRLFTKRNLVWFTPAIALLISVFVTTAWIASPARPPRKMLPQMAKQVEVLPLKAVTATPKIQANGAVIAAKSVTINAQVSGRVVSVLADLSPGTVVSAGDVLLNIDDSDYTLALSQAQASLAEAKADYQQELGEQVVAKRELELLTEQKLAASLTEQQRHLILRHPQLAKAKSLVDAAQAALKKAELNVSRTKIRAPFDGVISNKSIEIGAQVSTSTPLLSLIDTHEYWIEVTLPYSDSERLVYAGEINRNHVGAEASVATITLRGHEQGGAAQRVGEVYQRLPQLNASTRQSQILVRVADPLALKDKNRGNARLMVNDYVALSIAGTPMNNVFVIAESHVHNGNQLWFFDRGELRIKTINPVWRQSGEVFFNVGLHEGDPLIITDIANAYDGLKVSMSGTESPKKSAHQKQTGTGQDRDARRPAKRPEKYVQDKNSTPAMEAP